MGRRSTSSPRCSSSPVSSRSSGVNLHIQLLGTPRINEGWLERRLKNADERRAFLKLMGNVQWLLRRRGRGVARLEAGERRCSVITRAIGLAEFLNPPRLGAWPPLKNLPTGRPYNRAGLLVPRKWRYTSKLHGELVTLAHGVPDGQLDQTALRTLFPHQEAAARQPEGVTSVEVDGSVFATASPLMLNAEQIDAARRIRD